MRLILFHAQFGCTKILFLQLDAVGWCSQFAVDAVAQGVELLTILQACILGNVGFCEVNLSPLLHQGRGIPQIIDIFLVVTTKFLVDGFVESGQIFGSDLRAIVLQQRGLHFAIESRIPCVAVVIKGHIGCFGRALPLLFECLQRTVTQFIGAHKGFVEERCRTTCIETLGIKRFQGIEIELALQVFCRVLPPL